MYHIFFLYSGQTLVEECKPAYLLDLHHIRNSISYIVLHLIIVVMINRVQKNCHWLSNYTKRDPEQDVSDTTSWKLSIQILGNNNQWDLPHDTKK